MELKSIIEMINKIKKPFFWNGKEWENASNFREKLTEEGYENIQKILAYHGIHPPKYDLFRLP